MCHSLDLYQTLEIFKIKKNELHQLKEIIIGEHRDVLKKHRLGDNPNLAWCGSPEEKMLCFQSQQFKGRQKCTQTLIKEIINE
jgi:hypothetical protein